MVDSNLHWRPSRMTEENPHPAFSLPPLDAKGRAIGIGSIVKVLSVESCVSGLPLNEQRRLQAIVGQVRQVVLIDRFGFVWLSLDPRVIAQTGDFCLFPRELLRIRR